MTAKPLSVDNLSTNFLQWDLTGGYVPIKAEILPYRLLS